MGIVQLEGISLQFQTLMLLEVKIEISNFETYGTIEIFTLHAAYASGENMKTWTIPTIIPGLRMVSLLIPKSAGDTIRR